MGKRKAGMVRFRILFDDYHLLNNGHISDGHRRCWLLLKPNIATFADLASHLCKKFSLREHLILCIGDFVLPPFESTRIIKDEDIIRVKQKNFKLKDVCKPFDIQDLVKDAQALGAHSLTFNSHITAAENSEGNLQENVKNENAAHACSSSLGILVPKQKREHSLELDNSMKKRHKYNCTEKQVTRIGVEDVNSGKNITFCDVSEGSKMELHAKANTHDNGLVIDESSAEVNFDEQVTASSIPCKVRQQPEGIKKVLESELHTVRVVIKEYEQLSSETIERGQTQFTKKTFKGENDYDWLGKKPVEDSPENIAKTDVPKIDFGTLFPLTRSPMKGDILAYRYVEPTSTVFPELSSPQVGKVSMFDKKSSVILLVEAPEFEVFSEENSDSPMLLERVSPYNEDGSLEIELSALIDVRLLKACDSEELACLPEGELNRIKDHWKMTSARSNWNQSDSHHTGREKGAKYSKNERRASSSWIHGASPAAALFWETVLSKVPFGKGGSHSGPGKL